VSEWFTSLSDLEGMTAGAIYVVLFTVVFVESGLLVGFFLPGDTVLFTAGLLAADPDRGLSLPVLVAGVLVAAVAGDAVGYWTGRRLGRPWLLRKAGRGARHVERAERFYARYGALAVVVARFIPWVRTFTPIVAGVGRMPYPLFLAANVAGALIWGAGITVLGYVAHANPGVRHLAYAVAGTAIALSVLVPLLSWARGRRARGSRESRESRASRTAGATAAPAPTEPPAAPTDRNRS
jgi:membrane-associated protein